MMRNVEAARSWGVKSLDEFFCAMGESQDRPPVHSLEFKAYFERVIKSSKNIMEAMERLGYRGPSSVRYHMKRLGVVSPIHWYGHPSPYSHEFASYFENVVRTSKSARDAAAALGYAAPCMIYHHSKRLGIATPSEWILKPGVRRQRQGLVPEIMMMNAMDREWSSGLVQGEAAIIAYYSKKVDITALEVRTGMSDPDPIFKLCDCFGVARPKEPRPRPHRWKPIWECVVGGLRAYRVIEEMLPYLLGEKLKEAERALEFFAPDGYHPGRFGGFDIWPEAEFPLRKRGLNDKRVSRVAKEHYETGSAEA